MECLSTLALAFAAYLLGSVPSGYWLGRWVAGVDVRTLGSKNIGASNVARNLGFRWGILVLILDVTKAALPLAVAIFVWGPDPRNNILNLAAVALAVFFGNLYSVFLRFQGGKGVATSLGIILVLMPKAALPALFVFLLVTWRWRYISLGSIIAALSLPIWTAISGYQYLYTVLTAVLALFVTLRHRTNINALLAGEETRL